MKRSIMVLITSVWVVTSALVAGPGSGSPAAKASPFQQVVFESGANGVFSASKRLSDLEPVAPDELEAFVHETVKSELPARWRNRSRPIGSTLLAESAKHGLDPLLVMAVIRQESAFRPNATGSDGEQGLMQIRPSTALWIARRIGFKWGSRTSLYDPGVNLRIGIAYLSYLRENFAPGPGLFLSAYNFGPENLRRHIRRHSPPKIYVTKVMNHYLQFRTALQQSVERPSLFARFRDFTRI